MKPTDRGVCPPQTRWKKTKKEKNHTQIASAISASTATHLCPKRNQEAKKKKKSHPQTIPTTSHTKRSPPKPRKAKNKSWREKKKEKRRRRSSSKRSFTYRIVGGGGNVGDVTERDALLGRRGARGRLPSSLPRRGPLRRRRRRRAAGG